MHPIYSFPNILHLLNCCRIFVSIDVLCHCVNTCTIFCNFLCFQFAYIFEIRFSVIRCQWIDFCSVSATLGDCEGSRIDHRCHSMVSEGMISHDGEDAMGRHGRQCGRPSWRMGGSLLPNSVFCEVPCDPDNSPDYVDGC